MQIANRVFGRHPSHKKRATLMEYLTLQDIPHRHYNPVHSHSMASSQSTERPMGSMVAAVSETSTPSSSAESRRLPSPHSSLPLPSSVAAPERSSFATNWHPDNHPVAEGDPSRPFISSLQPRRDYQLARQHSTYLENDIRDKFLTSFQNVHMRSSPPIQPNEHGYADKLPSFSEVCCGIITRSREC